MTNTRLLIDGENLIEHRSVDVEPVLDANKALQNAGAFGNADMRHAARVPGIVIEQYCKTQGITFSDFMNDPVHIRRLLNDPELSGFRIWQGRA